MRVAATNKDMRQVVHDAAQRAQCAAQTLGSLNSTAKNRALCAAADALLANKSRILAANAEDLAAADAAGITVALRDRLTLTAERIDEIAAGLHLVAQLADPVGEVIRGSTMPNGLRLRQVRVPLGVIGIVYEARPNVTVDAFGLAHKSGNAVLLRGSSSVARTNEEIVSVLRAALQGQDLPADAVILLPSDDHASVTHLIQARGLVDVVIPRGGDGLIDAVIRDATVPTIETGVGNCHVYVHRAADLDIAEKIVINAKTRRPSVCNAAETLLVDADIAAVALPRLVGALQHAGVTVHQNPTTTQLRTEFLSMDIALAVVSDLDAAIAHINTYGTGHTEAIVTTDLIAAQRFSDRVDAAAIMVNASTAFTDGGQFGFGAEMGISTQKLHARGPLGLPELTSTKWIVTGEGHTRDS